VKPLSFFATHPVFTRDQFLAAIEAQGGQDRRVEYLLRHHTASGRVVRLRRGLYASVPAGTEPGSIVVEPYLLATALQPDAVVAYHAALQFRGRTYSVWRRFHYTTSRRVRPFTFRGAEFVPVVAPRDQNADSRGVVEERHAGGVVRVTTYERTLVDLLSAPDLGGGWEEIWRSLEMVEFFDVDAVTAFALALDSPVVAARVGFFLDQHRETLMVDRAHLARLLAEVPKQPCYFDPRRTRGKLVKDWNLIVPEQVLGRTWAEVS
jgi:predicted transcriptional regulator of viral defense system